MWGQQSSNWGGKGGGYGGGYGGKGGGGKGGYGQSAGYSQDASASNDGGYDTSGYGKAAGKGGAPGGKTGGAMATQSGSGTSQMMVSGCKNPTVSNIIKGSYTPSGSNHGKPVYKKDDRPGSVSVLIYYWDERDGPSFSGWWFGPKVGGDQVWAYNMNRAAPSPPPAGWKVPWDGPVDDSLKVTGGGAPAAGAGGGGQGVAKVIAPQKAWDSYQQPSGGGGGAQSWNQQSAGAWAGQSQGGWNQQQGGWNQGANQAELRKKHEEQLAARKKQQEAEQARRQEELKKKREEEDAKRKQMVAATAVRKIIQRVRIANPETYDTLRAELEEAIAQQLEAMGEHAEKVSQEAEKALQQAQDRIDEIHRKREEEEKKKLEDERKKKEDAEMVQRQMKEAGVEVTAAEEKVTKATEAAKSLSESGADVKPDTIVASADSTETLIKAAKEALEKTTESLAKRREEVNASTASSKEVKKELGELNGKVAAGRRNLDKIANQVKAAREKAAKKAAALKKEEVQKKSFTKMDTGKKGKLDRKDVQKYSKTDWEFDLPADVLDKIMRHLEPITFEKYRRVVGMVAIAKSDAKARIKRKEEEEKQKALEAQRKVVQAVIDEADESLKAGEKNLISAEQQARPLGKDTALSPEKIEETVAAVEALIKEIQESLAAGMEKLKKAEEDCNADEALKGYDKKDVPKLKTKHARMEGRVEKVVSSSKAAKEKAVRKVYAELEQLRASAVGAMRGFMQSESKTGDQLFEQIGGGKAIPEDKFVSFMKGLKDMKWKDIPEKADGEEDSAMTEKKEQQAEKLFKHIVGEEENLTKEKFTEIIRLFYKVMKATVLTKELSIKAATVRRLDVGEVLEAVEGPSKEEGAEVLRVKCQAVNDDAVGWATISGNQGTVFLEPGGNLYTCVKETVLTDGLSVADSKTVRRISKGEVFEVIEFGKKDESLSVTRLKVKAKNDGATGFITLAGNQGTVFLEPC